jgi:hypothetical protein
MAANYLTDEDRPAAALARVAAAEVSRMLAAAPLTTSASFSRQFSFRGYDAEVGMRVIPFSDTLRSVFRYRWQLLVRVNVATARALGLDTDDLATSAALQALEEPVIESLIRPVGGLPATCSVHHQAGAVDGDVLPLHHRTMGKFRCAFYALGDT